ncbi:periplasmic sensor Signal transduction histidine kinase, partial [Pseudomonas syringae pv. actinidiae ICMP 18886]
MNSIFLRIYGGMLGVLVLVALLGVLALHVLNQERGEQYRERLPTARLRFWPTTCCPSTPSSG